MIFRDFSLGRLAHVSRFEIGAVEGKNLPAGMSQLLVASQFQLTPGVVVDVVGVVVYEERRKKTNSPSSLAGGQGQRESKNEGKRNRT